MKSLLTITFFLALLTSVFAQAPASFNYQGIARNLIGSPISSQAVQLRIAIIEGEATGTEVYKEIHGVTTTPLGIFNLQVGNGTAVNGDFGEIDWGNGDHFLQVEIDEDGGSDFQLVGTSQLLSVPYALYAENGGVWKKNVLETPGVLRTGVSYEENSTRYEFFHTDESFIRRREYPQFLINQTYSDGLFGQVGLNFLRRDQYGDEPTLEFAYAGDQTINRNFSWRVAGASRMFLKGNGFLGLGTTFPKATVHVADGDVYIEDINKGVIMKSPNGRCWRTIVSNTGQLSTASIPCPD